MSDTKRIDQKEGDAVLAKMLKAKPKPHSKVSLTKSDQKKPGGSPAKNRHTGTWVAGR